VKAHLAALLSGLLFGAGLVVSGMTRPDKVIAFLDLADGWDPSLAFVMVGAIGVHMALFRFVLRRPSPLYGAAFGVPTNSVIDGRLLGGAALFGLGWGLGGYCPGPGLVSVASGAPHALVFVATLTAGMALVKGADQLRERRPDRSTPVPATDG
jgi:uncharacterized membrane protein YedE/YeeE